MLKKFNMFSLHDSIIDIAIGVAIGITFCNLMTAFVHDILMPPLGLLFGDFDLSEFSLSLHTANSHVVHIKYGLFIENLIIFAVVTFVILFVLKHINCFNTTKVKTKK